MLKIENYKQDIKDVPNTIFKITDLKTNESFEIFYMNNLDLYWVLNSYKKKATFEIERTDLVLFRVFKELFDNLRTNKLFYYLKAKNSFFNKESHESYLKHIDKRLKPLMYDENSKTINFKSSDLKDWTRDSKRDYFEIKENENSYTLNFYNEGTINYEKCSVRINTNRSEYENLVCLFTHFYETLKDYYQCYQISLDDYSEAIKKLEKV